MADPETKLPMTLGALEGLVENAYRQAALTILEKLLTQQKATMKAIVDQGALPWVDNLWNESQSKQQMTLFHTAIDEQKTSL
jgi:hypothetical protein